MRAAGAILAYLGETNADAPAAPHGPRTYTDRRHDDLDAPTRRNLELHWTGRGADARRTPSSAPGRTKTAMGWRLLRRWMLAQPLIDRAAIAERLEAVEAFVTRTALRMQTLTPSNGSGIWSG